MLTHLIIRDFAIIDELEIAFTEGLTVLTGETGAGKSILVDALNLVLGGRASGDVIRSGAEEAVVEAIFEPDEATWVKMGPCFVQRGLEAGGQLIVRRIVSRAGRNKVFINGSAARLGVLRDLMRGLVDISGQHEHYSLMDAASHLSILDGFGGLMAKASTVGDGVARIRGLEQEVAALQDGERQRLTQIDFLRFQLDEIEAVALEAGEEDTLLLDLERLRHAEQLREVARGAIDHLYEDQHSAADLIDSACNDLGRAAEIDPGLEKIRAQLEVARIQLAEVSAELRTYAEGIESDPARLAEVDDRLDAIGRLKRKHGGDVQTILDRAESIRRELETLETAEARIDNAQTQLQELRKVVMSQARTLSDARKASARRLGQLVEAELSALDMAGCRFEVMIHHGLDEMGNPIIETDRATYGSLGARGVDEVEFLIAPNRGEVLRSMTRIASGGELSRIMLAIKGGLLLTDPVETYVFDEIDSGIGGRIGEVVGRKIKELSHNRQVVCVTHLAQIAAFADRHMLVQKQPTAIGDRVVSSIRPLAPAARVAEVARMLGGVNITRKTVEHAEEMLEEAANFFTSTESSG